MPEYPIVMAGNYGEIPIGRVILDDAVVDQWMKDPNTMSLDIMYKGILPKGYKLVGFGLNPVPDKETNG